VEIAVPVVQYFPGEVDGTDQFREILAGEGELAPVHLAEQILARHRHILGIGGAQVVVALVGAGAALDAGIQKNRQ
jgi:hypothetical protein